MIKQKRSGTRTQPQTMPAGNAMAAPVAREQMIAVAAFYLAERRGFSPGQEVEDWLRAEEEIDSGAAGTTAQT